MSTNLIRPSCCILFIVIAHQYLFYRQILRIRVAALDVDKRRFTGYGTYIANMTANSKLPKYAKVDVKMKQRVLAHFFKVEGINKTEIQRRLKLRFYGQAIDLNEKETSQELEKRRNLHYNVVERIIIQFLNAERVRPADIFKRLRRVSDHGQHWCNVYRWVYKFRKGRTEVANIPCVKTNKPRLKAVRSNTGNSTNNFNLSKCAKVSIRVKQKVLVEFLRAENLSESEINDRLHRQFGNQTLNLKEANSLSDSQELCNIHPSVRERVIIQFLNEEGVRPLEIIKRLVNHNMLRGRHRCYVYRWVSKFREGRTDVENKHWMKMRKQK